MSMSAPAFRSRCHGQSKREAGSELPQLPRGKLSKSGVESLGGVDLRQVTVLSKADWEGIQYRLNKKHIEAERIRQIQEEKQRLHELSVERVKNWTNTVYGQRQKKLEDRRIRLEKEEEERKKIDVEEAIVQAEKRKSAIEKAKIQQYYQTDRVKAFHSALLLTEVLKERDAQLELKKLREEGLISQDKDYLKKHRLDLEAARQRDEEQKMKVRLANMNAREIVRAQARERQLVAEKQKQDELIEGEELQRLALEQAEEERKKQQWRHEMGKQQAMDNKRQMEDIALMKRIEKMQEEEEDEECRLFATAKKKMMKMRGEKERQLRDEKQAQLDKIKQKLSEQMHQQVSEEENRIKAAVAEKEAKLAAEEAEKAQKRSQALQSIAEHRLKQAKRNEEQTAAEKEEAIKAMIALREAATIYSANETEKLRLRREEALEFAKIHQEQADERQRCEQARRAQDLEHNRQNLDLDEINEAQFQAYARDVIDHCDKRGRNTYPLRKVASQVVPGQAAQRTNYVVADETGVELPNYQTCATDATKLTINGKNETDKRLGFVW